MNTRNLTEKKNHPQKINPQSLFLEIEGHHSTISNDILNGFMQPETGFILTSVYNQKRYSCFDFKLIFWSRFK